MNKRHLKTISETTSHAELTRLLRACTLEGLKPWPCKNSYRALLKRSPCDRVRQYAEFRAELANAEVVMACQQDCKWGLVIREVIGFCNRLNTGTIETLETESLDRYIFAKCLRQCDARAIQSNGI